MKGNRGPSFVQILVDSLHFSFHSKAFINRDDGVNTIGVNVQIHILKNGKQLLMVFSNPTVLDS